MTDPNRVTVTYNGVRLEGARDARVHMVPIDDEYLSEARAFLKRQQGFVLRGRMNGLRTAWVKQWERLVAELQFQRDVRSALLSALQTSVPERNYYREYATHSRPSDVAKWIPRPMCVGSVFENDTTSVIAYLMDTPNRLLRDGLASNYETFEEAIARVQKQGTYLQARNS